MGIKWLNYFICKINYSRKLKKLKKISQLRTTRVLFLVRESSKWTYQSLYEEMTKSDLFMPIVAVSLLNRVVKGRDNTRNNIEETYNFFKTRGYNVVKAYENGKFVDLKTFTPDIIFYDQPWELPKIHHPTRVSAFALTCYFGYGSAILEDKSEYKRNFHYFLWRYFVGFEEHINKYVQYNKKAVKNCVATGYPKLKPYLEDICDSQDKIWEENNKVKIIYAPHHSFEDNGLNFATFQENGKFILDLAKKYRDKTTWIFKPHPRLKYALLKNNIMTEKEIDDYYAEWNTVGKVYLEGDYLDIFRTSDLMITDCCSFLFEYLFSKKPLIRLINPKAMLLDSLGKDITSEYYMAKNNTELLEIFLDLINNKDLKLQTRHILANKYINKLKNSKSIYNFLEENLSK